MNFWGSIDLYPVFVYQLYFRKKIGTSYIDLVISCKFVCVLFLWCRVFVMFVFDRTILTNRQLPANMVWSCYFLWLFASYLWIAFFSQIFRSYNVLKVDICTPTWCDLVFFLWCHCLRLKLVAKLYHWFILCYIFVTFVLDPKTSYNFNICRRQNVIFFSLIGYYS